MISSIFLSAGSQKGQVDRRLTEHSNRKGQIDCEFMHAEAAGVADIFNRIAVPSEDVKHLQPDRSVQFGTKDLQIRPGSSLLLGQNRPGKPFPAGHFRQFHSLWAPASFASHNVQSAQAAVIPSEINMDPHPEEESGDESPLFPALEEVDEAEDTDSTNSGTDTESLPSLPFEYSDSDESDIDTGSDDSTILLSDDDTDA